MSGHTPGPWEVVTTDQCGAYFVVGLGNKDISLEEDGANARLIAAAPDLLKACHSMIQAWDYPTADSARMRCDAVEGIKLAILKATGEEKQP